jgi:hypothetical protein
MSIWMRCLGGSDVALHVPDGAAQRPYHQFFEHEGAIDSAKTETYW